jgi:predicted metal-dependent phosphoesterase TrpH
MSADLHTHTTRSDGTLSPAALVRLAGQSGLRALALTDHDTVTGIGEASQAAVELGVELIPGVELSIRERDPNGGEVVDNHLLGLLIEPTAPDFGALLDELQAGRRAMAHATLARLAELGLPLDPRRVEELAAGAAITRPHIARALVEAGYVANERQAFERYLGNGKLGLPERPTPTPAEAIAAVRAAGGVAALAHPVFARDAGSAERLASIPRQLDRLQALGLRAVECDYPDATAAIAEKLTAWARERGLLITGGSDFHGPGKTPYAPLGQCAVDDRVVDELRAAARHGPRLPAEFDRS